MRMGDGCSRRRTAPRWGICHGLTRGRCLGPGGMEDAGCDLLRRVAKTQHPDGYWSENSGSVANYGAVYMDSLGIYAAASGDEEVLPVLRKATVFSGALFRVGRCQEGHAKRRAHTLTAHVVLMRRNERPAVRIGLPAGARSCTRCCCTVPMRRTGRLPRRKRGRWWSFRRPASRRH